VRSGLEEGYDKGFEVESEIITILELGGIGKDVRWLEDLLVAVFEVLDVVSGHDVFFGENTFELSMFLKIELGEGFSALDHRALGDLEGGGVDLAVDALIEGGIER
jgi:hypothetical protein